MRNERVFSQSDLSFELANVSEERAKLLMVWRNDHETLKNSFHCSPKRWPEFWDEYRNSFLGDPSVPAVFVRKNNECCAFLRFERVEDPELLGRKCCEISIVVGPLHRGKGVGLASLQAASSYLRGLGIDLIVARILRDNQASVKLFSSAGYKYFECRECLVPDTGRVASISIFHKSTSSVDTWPSAIGRPIGAGHGCFVIAEAGSNWRMGTEARDRAMARRLIEVAAEAGADAVKFQTYRPESTYVRNAGESKYLEAAGVKESIFDIFTDLSMPYEMLPELANYAKGVGIEFMSSPFSVEDFDAIDPFVTIHKIASYEISHIRLLERAAFSGKPLVLSTGASDLRDISWAVNFFKERSDSPIVLMQCTARYPSPLENLNLAAIQTLKAKFGVPVGLSDHSLDPFVGPVAAVGLGATIIEKHFTLDRGLPGPDHAFAITARELKEMISLIRKAEKITGSGEKQVQAVEQELFAFARRGIQAIKRIEPGDKFVECGNIAILRPGKQLRGIHPKHLSEVLASRSRRLIEAGDGIQLDDIEKC